MSIKSIVPMLISDEEYARLVKKAEKPINPCITAFGPGPDGKTCKTCKHLTRVHYSKVILKCGKRDDLTHGAKTDQRSGWAACAKYAQGENSHIL